MTSLPLKINQSSLHLNLTKSSTFDFLYQLRTLITSIRPREAVFPMSAPTRELGKLSIGSMSTQAQRQGGSVPYEAEAHSNSESEEESSSDEEASAPPSDGAAVRGTTGIPYNLSRLSQAARTRAIHGLKGEFAVDRCRAIRGGFDFDVTDHGRVRLIGGSLACSCQDFGREEGACRHIFVSFCYIREMRGPNPLLILLLFSVGCRPIAPRILPWSSPASRVHRGNR